MIDGITHGKGQTVVTLPKKRSAVIIVENGQKRGYAQLHSELSTTGVLDIVGGCLILLPFLGFLSGGAWTLDKDSIYVEAR